MPPRGRRPKAPSIARQHAAWVRLLPTEGPFIAVPVLAAVFGQGLDTVPGPVMDRLRLAWKEVQEAPDLLNAAWCDFVLKEVLRLTGGVIAEGAALPGALRTAPGDHRARPDGVLYGPDGEGGRAERLLLFRRPWTEALDRPGRAIGTPVEHAADLCRHRGTPLALLTNGRSWVLVHARPNEPATIASFDADLWLEETDLLRAFATLLSAQRVLPPATAPDGGHSASLAALFARSAEAQAEITTTLGAQVRDAVELLVAEMGQLDRAVEGRLLAGVEPRDAYRSALVVMMRLVFLLYAEEARLMPVGTRLYDLSYSVGKLFDQLEDDRSRHGAGVGDRRSAAWPRLIATFRAVHGGSQHDAMRTPPYGGRLFDPERFPWLEDLPVSDLVVHAILEALLFLKKRGERLSYKGLGVEQIGHVYEGLLEFSCTVTGEPYVRLIGKQEAKVPLSELEAAAEGEEFMERLAERSGATPSQLTRALAAEPAQADVGRLDAACDNDHDLAARALRFWGLYEKDLRGRPAVFPAGSLIITRVGDRRSTGTHYTPRELADEVVEHTLAPLCFSPGPAEGAERAAWHAKSADELLDLKVLDPAMGSGAFLVSACRYLAERVMDAWERDGLPEDVRTAVGPGHDREDLVLEARRRVAARCVYGVDRDEMAVELAKLSMWLVTLAKDKPFSFLDHALRTGDSLVGLTSIDQLLAFHLDPQEGYRVHGRLTNTLTDTTQVIVDQVERLRRQIEAEPVRDAVHGEELARKLALADRLVDDLRFAADAVVAAALTAAIDKKQNRRPHWEDADEHDEDHYERRLASLAEDVDKALAAVAAALRSLEDENVDPDEYGTRLDALLHGWAGSADLMALQEESELAAKDVRELITPMLQGPRKEPIRPLHWPLEFPEVMGRGGFDAVVGNPPFIGGKKLTGRIGEDVREYIIYWVARNQRGSADLCSYFLLRCLDLAPLGRIGLITTNTIAQGDSKEVGLDQAADQGWDIYRAAKSQPWPGTASLEVSLLWAGHAPADEVRVLNGSRVPAITTSLNPISRVTGNPYRLAANSDRAFQGSIILGKGFILTIQEARTLLAQNPNNKDVLRPYLTGEDLNQRWDSSASRWVIDFNDWPLERAQKYPEIFSIIENKVRPERQRKRDDGTYVLRNPLPQRWWQYADKRPALREALRTLDRVLAIARVSRTGMPAFTTPDQIMSEALVVIATDKYGDLALLSSSMHFMWWTVKGESTLRTDSRYTPTDGFEKFPFPSPTEEMEQIGFDLHAHRRDVLKGRKDTHPGLTSVYNLTNDPIALSSDIERLRQIHVEVDEAVREAYALDEEREPGIREFEARVASAPLPSWREIDLGHGFHETRQGVRFTISPQAQLDVLDKLLALNHYRYQQEQEKGLHTPKKRTPKRAPNSKAPAESQGSVEDALFAPPDTLF
ncbi:Eco57I restriction-modification methylase domain-containing protein [Spirillospora albida]|uniref:Eco57I restriction-modification methylase domain-containing protein n=1 Tax=Spirillospora albida TaxID=58123 RepID=UPI0004BEA126|nr:DNA methyltransferase [Spirillospora albida]